MIAIDYNGYVLISCLLTGLGAGICTMWIKKNWVALISQLPLVIILAIIISINRVALRLQPATIDAHVPMEILTTIPVGFCISIGFRLAFALIRKPNANKAIEATK